MNNHPAPLTLTSVRKEVWRWGGLIVLIYLMDVAAFPLVPYIHHEGAMLDLEMILRNGGQWFIWLYMLGLGLQFYGGWRVVRMLHAFSRQSLQEAQSLRGTLLGIGIASGAVLLGLYPITALDVAVYVVNARIWTLYGGNPLTTAPEAFPNDPYVRFAGEYASKTSPYGPVWEMTAQIPARLGVTDIVSGIVAMKIIALLAVVGMAVLIGWYAKQQNAGSAVGGVTALGFFVLNPLVMLEAVGNGHNDILMVAFVTLGLILWQRGRWAWATFALTLAALVKLPALIVLPLFGLAVVMETDSWSERFKRGLGMAAIFLTVFLGLYRLMGPFPEVFTGVMQSFSRRSFSPAYATYVIAREIAPGISPYILSQSRSVLLAVYTLIVLAQLRRKLTLLEAGFAATLAMIYLTNAFRMWYILWLLPFAALNLNSRTYWRSWIFSLTTEFSILSYYVLWRWSLRHWTWGEVTGPLAPYWDYFKIMTPFTVAWQFTLPFLGDLMGWMKDGRKYLQELWV